MSHARLAPSNARWPFCAGSPRESERYEDIAGDAAIDGTGSHLLLEFCIEDGVDAATFVDDIIGENHEDKPEGWLVDAERAARVQMCLDYVARRRAELEEAGCDHITVEAESKSDPGGAFGRDDWYGTCDITITAFKEDEVYFVEAIDYKDGRGYVSEKNNTQLVAYLFGKLRPFVASGPELVKPFYASKVPLCRMTIVQPKTNPPVRYADTPVVNVITHAKGLATAAHATDNPNAPLTAGKHCQWCPANPKRGGHCKVVTEESVRVMNEVSASPDMELLTVDAAALSDEQLSKVMDAREGLITALDGIAAEAQKRVEAGKEIAGWGMRPGNSSYVWNADDATIAKALKSRRVKLSEAYPSKLVSVAQMRKLDVLSEQQVLRIEKEFVTQVAGKLKLKKLTAVTFL